MSDMRIFKVTRAEDDRIEYDEYSSFVCVAPDQETARRLHPRDYHAWVESTAAWHWKDGETGLVEPSPDNYHSWTIDIDSLVVELIGTSYAWFDARAVVVLASYHAG